MAFNFRLQTVLEHRQHLEDMALNALAVRQRALHECEEHIAWLKAELNRSREELWKREQEGLAARDYVLANEYVTVLRLQVMRNQARLPQLQAETEKARLLLVEATKARKILEALRDRHRMEYDEEQRRAEQRVLDEVAVGAYVRRMPV
jgi:flagellar protein FliJ